VNDPSRSVAVLGLLVATGLIAVLAFVKSKERELDPSLGTPEAPADTVDRAVDPESTRPTGLPSAPGPTERESAGAEELAPTSSPEEVVFERSTEFLEEFWGPEWAELRDQLERERPHVLERHETLPLTADLVPAPLETLSAEIQTRALETFDSERWRRKRAWLEDAEAWPDAPDRAFLESALNVGTSKVSEETLQSIAEVCARHELELEPARFEFFELARAVLAFELRSGGYRAWPLVMVGPGIDARHGGVADPAPRGRNEVDISLSLNGLWAVQTFVWSDDYPEVGRSSSRLEALGQARKAEVTRLILAR
jgi:hypothetical protein